MSELKTPTIRDAFAEIEKTQFWALYRAELQARLQAAQQTVMTQADGAEATLRVAAALMSAYQTALNLPQILLQQAELDDALANLKDSNHA